MTTSVEGRVVRPVALDTFADVTDAPLAMPGGIDPLGLLFDGVLTADQVEAIWERMTSRDDADQAARVMLRDAAAAGAINLAEMHLAYTLGDPIPAPVLPQT